MTESVVEEEKAVAAAFGDNNCIDLLDDDDDDDDDNSSNADEEENVVKSSTYMNESMQLLKNEFPRISIAAMTHVFCVSQYSFPKSFDILTQIQKRTNELFAPSADGVIAVDVGKNELLRQDFAHLKFGDHYRIVLHKNREEENKRRRRKKSSGITDKTLRDEVNQIPYFNQKPTTSKSNDNNCIDLVNCSDDDDDEDNTSNPKTTITYWTCLCCFNDEVTTDNIGQCADGHLFCMECIIHHFTEQIHGQNTVAKIQCMNTTETCTATYPPSIIQRLPSKLQQAYHDLSFRSNVQQANVKNLIQCPECAFLFELLADSDGTTSNGVTCPQPDCHHRFCRLCQQEPHDDPPLTCEQAKDKGSAVNRAAEVMTEALVRTCTKPGCNTRYYKEDGCNKMTCPKCKTHMCYVCRAQLDKVASVAYTHFCQTPHCQHKRCGKCVLYTKTQEDNAMAVKEALEQHVEENVADEAVANLLKDNLGSPKRAAAAAATTTKTNTAAKRAASPRAMAAPPRYKLRRR